MTINLEDAANIYLNKAVSEITTEPKPDDVFDASKKAIEELIQRSVSDQDLEEALSTTADGNSIIFNKKSEIRINKINNPNTYDIINSVGGTIAEDLSSYEIALAIVKMINSGLRPLSKEIRQVIYLEGRYFANKNDFINFKRVFDNAEKAGKQARAGVAIARMQKAKDNLNSIKKNINDIIDDYV